MHEATVDRVIFIPPCWFKVFLREGNRTLMIHWNWITKHGDIYPTKQGYVQTALKPGDKIRFEIAPPVYPFDKENIYVRHLEVIPKSLVNVEVDSL